MYYQNTWKDQLTKIEYHVNGSLSYYQTFIYDVSGNVTNLVDSRTSYAYKNFQWDGRQLSIYSAYCNSISFKYNDQGIRTRKSQGTCSGNVITNYTLAGDKVLVESRSNGITLSFTYDVDGTLLSMNYNGAEYFYITNLQGDIIELVDINGNSVVKYKYDALGNTISQTSGSLANINPYRYRGYRFDIETGLYYLQSRYYDPTIGRFISADGLVGEIGDLLTHNMYAYCANNPVMNVDPSGEFFQLAVFPPLLLAAIAALAILYVIGNFNEEILDFVDEAIKTIESEFEKTLEKEYTVYTLIDIDGTVKYVGRVKTANYSARMEYHRITKGLSPGPKIDNLNYWECRGIEQLGILAHSSGWFDVKTNPSGNKINGIGRLNPFKFDYYGAGIRYIWNNL
jgi:RHS repeat-associated protein